MLRKVVALGTVQNYVVGWVLHYVYLPRRAEAPQHHGAGHEAAHELSPALHFLRDSTLALPVTITVLLLVSLGVRALAVQAGSGPDTTRVKISFAMLTAVAMAVASGPEVLAHSWLFDEQLAGVSLTSQLTGVVLVTLRYAFALTLIAAVLFGVPWRAPRSTALGLPIHGEI